MSQDRSCELLVALIAGLCTFFWIPFGNFTVLEEGGVATTLHLVQLTTDLLQGTQLGLEVDIVSAASLHLLVQIQVQLTVLCRCLSGSLSSSGFLVSCRG
jgi:hypothetical protein